MTSQILKSFNTQVKDINIPFEGNVFVTVRIIVL